MLVEYFKLHVNNTHEEQYLLLFTIVCVCVRNINYLHFTLFIFCFVCFFLLFFLLLLYFNFSCNNNNNNTISDATMYEQRMNERHGGPDETRFGANAKHDIWVDTSIRRV